MLIDAGTLADRISNAFWSDYSTMAVRTGPPGSGGAGLSILMLVDSANNYVATHCLCSVPLKDTPGVTMRRIRCTGQYTAGATFVELDNVQVPAENLVGEENKGMRYLMTSGFELTFTYCTDPTWRQTSTTSVCRSLSKPRDQLA